jgi:KDO2-lipid IV(A) lauroyltransferase
MNWEYAHLAFARNMNIPWIGIYMPISNKHIDRLFLKIRGRFDTIMVSATDFRTQMRPLYQRQYALALIADQNPGIPKNAYWLNFFNKPTPFIPGPEKGAIKNNTAVVFVNFVKIRRGYYRFEPTIITENGNEFKDGELTLKYRDFLEDSIRKQPDNYLWSHRRWKWNYEETNRKRWIDTTPPPAT